MKLSSLRLSDHQTKGIWFVYQEGIEFLIARLGNREYTKYLRAIGKPHSAQIRHDVLDDEVLEGLSREAIAHTVLLDWKNVEDDNGQPLKYTPAIGEKVLNDDEFDHIYKFIVTCASQQEVYQRRMMEENLGKLPREPDGNADGR